MAVPSTKATLKTYCLRALGFGVIDINVSDDQVDDRLDEALQYFAQYHYDGIERMYLKHLITSADVTRARGDSDTTATDVVLAIVEKLREVGVVEKFVEFFGSGMTNLSLTDRATISNMAPEYGATCGFFPVDNRTIFKKICNRTYQKTVGCKLI